MAATDSVGFDREEMYSKSLAGETTAPSIHFFVCTGKATEWSSHLDEDDNPVTALSKQLKNAQDDIRRSGQEDLFAKARITACEVSDGDNLGDVIVFPHMCKVPNVASTAGGAVAFAQSVASSADYLATHGIPLSDTANIFACAHAARDARCGTCGPVLMSKLKAEAKQLGMTKVNVRGCSHIGGHKYAGNLVVLRKTAEGTPLSDWLGYITPEKCKAVLEVIQTGQTLNIANPGLAAKNWRAQSGLQPSEHAEACAGCDVAGDIEDIVVNSSPLFHVVFILGGPGSGKGTQCEMLVDHFDFLHLSAGDLLRAERNDPNSEHGPLIQEYIKEGKIVPVEITVQLLLRAMKESGRTHILIDGFPRNEDNLAGWERVVGDAAHVHGVLFLDCPEKVMESRLLERGKTSGRTDDNAESIRKRFATYMNDTMPIIEHFGKQDRTWRVVSDRSVHEVFGEVSRVLSSKLDIKPIKPLPPTTARVSSTAHVLGRRRNIIAAAVASIGVALGCYWYATTKPSSSSSSSSRGARR